ncbi:MAG: septum formation protein Maf [Halobacteriovoraceae bacterium]|nr:septum formation protein Maf [Halobacteriovoraceae bacterium]
MQNRKYRPILASQSPRRKELLEHLGIKFEIRPPNIEEHSFECVPLKVVKDLSEQKGRAIYQSLDNEDYFVISSDTIVCLGDKIFGKPKDEEDARRILNELSGKTHKVITAVSFFFKEKKQIMHTFAIESEVTFREITSEIMDLYISTKDGFDKAGAYGIQGPGLLFVSRVNGSYSNVVGLPLDDLVFELKKLLGKDWRNCFE